MLPCRGFFPEVGLWIWRKGEKEKRDQEKLNSNGEGWGDKDIANNTEEITRKNVQQRENEGGKGWTRQIRDRPFFLNRRSVKLKVATFFVGNWKASLYPLLEPSAGVSVEIVAGIDGVVHVAEDVVRRLEKEKHSHRKFPKYKNN